MFHFCPNPRPPALVGWVRFWAPRFRVRSSHRARGCRHVRRGCAYPFVLFMLAGTLVRMEWGEFPFAGAWAHTARPARVAGWLRSVSRKVAFSLSFRLAPLTYVYVRLSLSLYSPVRHGQLRAGRAAAAAVDVLLCLCGFFWTCSSSLIGSFPSICFILCLSSHPNASSSCSFFLRSP